MITKLDHIQLAMPPDSEVQARAFFVNLLGMVEEAKPEPLASRGGCWFRAGSVIVHLGVEKEFRPQRKAHPAFCVADLDEVAELLLKNAHNVVWDNDLPGRRRFYTADPFGNRLEFMQANDGFSEK